jgi:predicted acylesterase/phospholipase RssA
MKSAAAPLAWLCCATAVSAVVLLSGCTPARPYPPLDVLDSARLVEVHSSPAGTDSSILQVSQAPRSVLVLSGGGMNGAYTAGVLKGWTASGQRPRFDVVTGISTGALIAPFALLGPEYDDALERAYTTARNSDIFRKRSPLLLPFADSLADSTPLRKHIEAQITPEVLAQVARAHAEGRRLYVGTTNLDSKQLVVWDLGAIAAGDDPDRLALFRRVLLASASVPGLLPPVPINVEVNGRRYTELHVDGGVTASLFLRPRMLGRGRGQSNEDTSVYVIVAGKLRPTPQPVARRLIQVSEQSIQGILQSQFEGDLLRIYLLARFTGARFALAAVPQEFPEGPDSLSFDPRVMRALFDEGYRSAGSGSVWRSTPPGLTAGEQPPPREGVRFELKEDTTPAGSSGR